MRLKIKFKEIIFTIIYKYKTEKYYGYYSF